MTTAWSVQTLIDHEQIRQLIYRYSRGADRHDEALLRSVYAADAVDNHGPFRGPAAQFVDRVMNPDNGGYVVGQHHIGNIIIELDGDTARTESVFLCYLISDADGVQSIDVLGGRYLDVITRGAEGWLIADRTVALDWSERRRLEDPIPGHTSFVPGHRGSADGSYALFGNQPVPL